MLRSSDEGAGMSVMASLDALLDADLRLSPTTGRVLRVDRSVASEMIDVFARRAVNPVIRADELSEGWPAAVEEHIASAPAVGRFGHLVDPESVIGSTDAAVGRLLDASRSRPMCLVLAPSGKEDRRLIDAALSPMDPHGLLLILVVETARGDRDDRSSSMESDSVLPVEAGHIKAFVALSDIPLTQTRLARLLRCDWAEVDAVVDELIDHRIIIRADDRRSTLAMRSAGERRAVRDGLERSERRRYHRLLAEEFIGLGRGDGDVGVLPDDAVAAARHALAAEEDTGFTVAVCRRAIEVCVRSGDLSAAIDVIDQLAACPLPVEDRVNVMCAAAHIHGRLGDRRARGHALDAAVQVASTGPLLLQQRVRAEIVATRRSAFAHQEDFAEIDEFLALGEALPPGVRALLFARRAETLSFVDAAECRRLLTEALALGDACDDDVFAFVCEATLHRLPSIDMLDQDHVRRLQTTGIGRALLIARSVRRCILEGTRRDLDELVLHYAAALRDHPMAAWQSNLATYRAVQALFDLDTERFRHAVDEIIQLEEGYGSLGFFSAYARYPLEALWGFFGGPAELGVFENLPIPVEGGITQMWEVWILLMSLSSGDPGAMQNTHEALSRLPEIGDDDWIASTWWPVLCLVAGSVGDRSLAARALSKTTARPDEWVLLGAMLPVGPVGFYLAEAQRLLGRIKDAHASCAAGLEAAKRMRSVGWVAWCSLQKASLLFLDGDKDGAHSFAEAALTTGRRLDLAPITREATRILASLQSPLTGQEAEVLRLVAEGLSNKQIARHVGVSVKRIETVLTSAYRRLGVGNRAQAVRAMLDQNPGPSGNAPTGAINPVG